MSNFKFIQREKYLLVKVELRISPVYYWVDGGVEEWEQFCHLREVEECCAELEIVFEECWLH